MKSQLSVTAVAAIGALFAPQAVATPVPSTETALAVWMGLYVCDNYNFTGYCVAFRPGWNVCTSLSAFGNGVSSAGPDPHNWCTLYSGDGCTGSQLQLYNPGISDLRDPGWDKAPKSFNCAAIWL